MSEKSEVTAYLQKALADNEAALVAESESRVIRCLLTDPTATKSLSRDLARQLTETSHGFAVVRLLLNFLAYEMPAVNRTEDDRQRVAELSNEIHAQIEALATAIELRSKLCSRSEITIPDSYHPFDWMSQAMQHNPYCGDLLAGTTTLREDADDWPSAADVLRAIIELENNYEPEHINNTNWAAANGNSSSYTPIIRALLYKQFTLIGKTPPASTVPVPNYRLADKTAAELINAVLQSKDGGISPDTVKKARQRLKAEVLYEAGNHRADAFIAFLS